VTDIVAPASPSGKVLRLAAALEVGSSHPLAPSRFWRAPRRDSVPVLRRAGAGRSAARRDRHASAASTSSSARRRGKGVVPLDAAVAARIAALNAEGKTVSVLVAGGAVAGLIAMRDEPRADAAAGHQGAR
jgi:Cd2+/Zn2+-exporting ATPase